MTIRPYQASDETALLRVWNRAMFADKIDPITWRTKVLLDPNFDPRGCFIAELAGEAVGFMLSIGRRVPFFDLGLEPERGWITAFGVDPDFQRQGIGSALLGAAVDRFASLGVCRIGIAPYVPNYFTPGPDVIAYAGSIEFLTKRGFREIDRTISMKADLTGYREPASIADRRSALADTGVAIRLVTSADIVPLLEFVRANFSADWHREATALLTDVLAGDPRNAGMVIAERRGEVLGYAQHRVERFGPFGVHTDQRGNGIGGVVLATTLAEMRRKSLQAAWFLWTDPNAARLYERHGFREVRRFAVLDRNH